MPLPLYSLGKDSFTYCRRRMLGPKFAWTI